jgi:hypothetical protein
MLYVHYHSACGNNTNIFPLVLAQAVAAHILGKYNYIFLLWLLLAQLGQMSICTETYAKAEKVTV